jgi:uncharacterized protein (DUF4415 family)
MARPSKTTPLDLTKATGQGWQTRINAALREAVAHGLTKA